MTISYKKSPVCKDPANRYMKKYANRVIRHTSSIVSGRAYRKHFETWYVCDYIFRCPYEEYREDGSKQEYRRWYRAYRMK